MTEDFKVISSLKSTLRLLKKQIQNRIKAASHFEYLKRLVSEEVDGLEGGVFLENIKTVRLVPAIGKYIKRNLRSP